MAYLYVFFVVYGCLEGSKYTYLPTYLNVP